MKKLLAVSVLFVGAFSSIFATNGPPVGCCIRVSRPKIPMGYVVDYRWQNNAMCPVKAVLLYTRNEKKLCADPNWSWTTRIINKIDLEKEREEKEEIKTKASAAEENREGVSSHTTAKPPVGSRGLQESATSAALKPDEYMQSTKAQQGLEKKSRRRKWKRKGKNRQRKRKGIKASQRANKKYL
ncbi:C-C motif chemokine 2-like [Hoplias malabaricus]|uniref:C-C motif chemokine 2-like n=1 Tax=Hoplias malabaricus TaxID=27720 RepID=UPI003462A893